MLFSNLLYNVSTILWGKRAQQPYKQDEQETPWMQKRRHGYDEEELRLQSATTSQCPHKNDLV